MVEFLSEDHQSAVLINELLEKELIILFDIIETEYITSRNLELNFK